MRKSTKAALLSGLVFPGAGHLFLRAYLRGLVLLGAALIALSITFNTLLNRALSVVDKINSGEVAYDASAIAEMAANTTNDGLEPTLQIALLVASACWIVGIFDSWRLGRTRDRITEP